MTSTPFESEVNHIGDIDVYNNEEYSEGMYESLVITLGAGEGDNFWCILFPPLCMIDENEDYEYKSFFKEIFNKFYE